jgi:sec-independent protein translocase protein TatA
MSISGSVFLFLNNIGGWEVLLIVLIFVLLFGAKKIPELARGIGKGLREFKDASKEVKNQIDEGMKDPKDSSNNA